MGYEIDAYGAIACTRMGGVHAQLQERESRAVTYNREPLIAEICERLAEGQSLRSICEDPHMPSIGTFLGWVAENSTLAEQYARAKAIGLDVLAEEMLAIADTPQEGETITSKEWGEERKTGDMIEHRRLQVDTRKWLLSKLAPKKYGERQAIEHSVSEDTASILVAARKRAGKGG